MAARRTAWEVGEWPQQTDGEVLLAAVAADRGPIVCTVLRRSATRENFDKVSDTVMNRETLN